MICKHELSHFQWYWLAWLSSLDIKDPGANRSQLILHQKHWCKLKPTLQKRNWLYYRLCWLRPLRRVHISMDQQSDCTFSYNYYQSWCINKMYNIPLYLCSLPQKRIVTSYYWLFAIADSDEWTRPYYDKVSLGMTILFLLWICMVGNFLVWRGDSFWSNNYI